MVGFSGEVSAAELWDTGGLRSRWSKPERHVCRGGKARTALGSASHSRAGKAGVSSNEWMKPCGMPQIHRKTNSAPEDRVAGRLAHDAYGCKPLFRTFH